MFGRAKKQWPKGIADEGNPVFQRSTPPERTLRKEVALQAIATIRRVVEAEYETMLNELIDRALLPNSPYSRVFWLGLFPISNGNRRIVLATDLKSLEAREISVFWQEHYRNGKTELWLHPFRDTLVALDGQNWYRLYVPCQLSVDKLSTITEESVREHLRHTLYPEVSTELESTEGPIPTNELIASDCPV